MTDNAPTYWLPTWWNWMQDWSDCLTCLEYNHSRCVSCEIPPGLLAMAQLVGGGTAVVGGSLRGNVTIHGSRQAKAASRQHGAERVHGVIQQQNQSLNVGLDRQQAKRLQQNNHR